MPIQASLDRLQKALDDDTGIFLDADMLDLMLITIHRLDRDTRAPGENGGRARY
jgi:hypothetical protein